MPLTGFSVPETVVDDAGNALKGVLLTVAGPGGYTGTATTDATTGVLRLGPLPVGDYTVTLGTRSVIVPVLASAADVQLASDRAAAALAKPAGGTAGQALVLDADAATVKWGAAGGPTVAPSSVPAGTVLSRPYDPARSLYNFGPNTTGKIRAGLARALSGGSNFRIANYGDSTERGSHGDGSASSFDTSPAGYLLKAAGQLLGMPVAEGPIWLNDPQDTRVTLGADWSRLGGWGLGNGLGNVGLAFGNAPTGLLTLSLPVCTAFRLLLLTNTGHGPASVSIDGGAATSVALNAALGTTTADFTGLANTTHTVTVTSTAAVGVFAVDPTIALTGGITVSRGGVGGTRVADWIAAGNGGGTDSRSVSFGTFAAPDLSVLNVELNDATGSGSTGGTGQTAVATYKTDMGTLVAAALVAGGVLLKAATPAAAGVQSSTAPLSHYTRALYELAEQHDVPLMDMQDRWKDYATVSAAPFNYVQTGDNLHPLARGYADAGRALALALLPLT